MECAPLQRVAPHTPRRVPTLGSPARSPPAPPPQVLRSAEAPILRRWYREAGGGAEPSAAEWAEMVNDRLSFVFLSAEHAALPVPDELAARLLRQVRHGRSGSAAWNPRADCFFEGIVFFLIVFLLSLRALRASSFHSPPAPPALFTPPFPVYSRCAGGTGRL